MTLSAPIKDQLKSDKIHRILVLKSGHRVFLTLNKSTAIKLSVNCDISSHLHVWLSLSTNNCVVLAARLISQGIKSKRNQPWLSFQMLDKHLCADNFLSQLVMLFDLLHNWYETLRIHSTEVNGHKDVFFKFRVELAR